MSDRCGSLVVNKRGVNLIRALDPLPLGNPRATTAYAPSGFCPRRLAQAAFDTVEGVGAWEAPGSPWG